MMGLTVADLVAKLGLDTGEFDRGMDSVAGKATRSEKVLGGISKAAMAGAVAAGALVVKSLDTYNDFGTAINTLTRLTGMSSQAASKLTGQWQRFGVDSQSGISATKYLAKNLDIAQQAALKTQSEIDGLDKGSKTYGESLSKLQVKLIGNEGAFARLGVSIFDAHGKLKSVDTILPLVRDKLSQMDDAGQRTAMTLKLFGRGGADMLGWLTKTPKEIAAVNKELAGLGMVWGGKQVKDWKALKDAQREMGLQWTALQLNLAQTLLPAMKTLMGYVQTGIKDWNNLSDGAQGFILKATGIAGVLGMIAPKAIAAAAAIRTMFAAGAAGGAASAAGSAGGGLLSGVGANVASAAGIGGASKGYQAMTASSMMGGAGVTPAAAIAGGAGGAAALIPAGLIVGAAVASTIYQAYQLKATADTIAQVKRDSGIDVTKNLPTSATAPGSHAELAVAQTTALRERLGAAAKVAPLVQKLSMQMDDASYGEFRKLYGSIKSIQLLAEKGIVLNTKNFGKQTTGDLRNLRSTMMSSLHITAKQAETVLNTIAGKKLDFNWDKQTGKELAKTKATVQSQGGAIAKALIAAGDKSGKGLADGLNRGQGPTKAAAARLKAGATGPVNPLPGVLAGVGKNASNSLAKGVGNVGPTKTAAGRLSAAAKPTMPDGFPLGASLGQGVVRGLDSQVDSVRGSASRIAEAAAAGIHITGQIESPSRVTRKLGVQFARGLAMGMLDGRSNVAGAAGRLAIAGIPLITGGSRGAANGSQGGRGGSSFTFGSVSVVLPPGDYGDSEDAGSAAADAFMQRTREIARGY